VLPELLGENDATGKMFRLGTLLSTLVLVAWRKPGDFESLLRRSAIVLIVFVSLQVFFSPQWILWLAPLLVPVAGKDRVTFWVAIALDLVMYLTFPMIWDFDYAHKNFLLGALTYARAGILLVLILRLSMLEFGPRR
jgi:hypothetical protein